MQNRTPELTQPQLPFDEIPFGHCHCGCGQLAPIAKKTSTRLGHVKGQPIRYVAGHNGVGKETVDITNQRFGRLTALGPTEQRSDGKIVWHCRCDCGNTTNVVGTKLRKLKTQSCGCINKELTSIRRTTHGLSKDKIFGIWTGIITRCNNSNTPEYKNYGGRGITICSEWHHDFKAFYDYVTQLPSYGTKGYTLDRIDNDGNYEPGNLRYATNLEQSRNQRTNHLLTHNGKTQCMSAWVEELGITRATIRGRLKAGWSVEDALTKSVRVLTK